MGVAVKRTMYQRTKVNVDMLNAVKSALADVSSVSPSSGLSSRSKRQPTHSLGVVTQAHTDSGGKLLFLWREENRRTGGKPSESD